MAVAVKILEQDISYSSTDDKNILKLVEMAKKGISFAAFAKILRSIPFSITEWSKFLHLSERTMQRYKAEKKAFDPIYSEKILEVLLLYNYGVEVFSNTKHFNIWLETRNIALGGIVPKQLMDTTFGINMLKDELTRIEHGVLA